MEKPVIRGQEILEKELEGHHFIKEELMHQWDQGGYSVSGYHHFLYSAAKGLKAKSIVEVGFGRTSYCLAKAAKDLEASYICCDMRDLEYLFSEQEQEVVEFVYGGSNHVWKNNDLKTRGIDFAFLDHFSSTELPLSFCLSELQECLNLLNPGGLIFFHDAADERYPVSKVITHLKHKKNIEAFTLPYNQGLGCIRYTGGKRPRLSYRNWLSSIKRRIFTK